MDYSSLLGVSQWVQVKGIARNSALEWNNESPCLASILSLWSYCHRHATDFVHEKVKNLPYGLWQNMNDSCQSNYMTIATGPGGVFLKIYKNAEDQLLSQNAIGVNSFGEYVYTHTVNTPVLAEITNVAALTTHHVTPTTHHVTNELLMNHIGLVAIVCFGLYVVYKIASAPAPAAAPAAPAPAPAPAAPVPAPVPPDLLLYELMSSGG